MSEFSPKLAMDTFSFYTACKTFRTLPDSSALEETASELSTTYVSDPASGQHLVYLGEQIVNDIKASIGDLKEKKVTNATARKLFADAQSRAFAFLEQVATC